MTQIEHLLRHTIGLDAATIGSTLIQRAVRLRMKSLGLKKTDDYEHLLQAGGREWNELIESVLVTETWFFRDREAFGALAHLVVEEWLPAHHTGPLRVLSVPCSSGEEPYSLVMALVEAGVLPQRFQIDAADISARALERAKLGVYRKNSFRGKDLGFRARYFRQTREGLALNPAIRSCVHFHPGNLLSADFLAGRRNYDFIFCRNLLIYFDPPTRRKALEKIERLLAPSGVLFVGPSEQPLVIAHGFVSAGIPMAFACRKAGDAPAIHAGHRQPAATPHPRQAIAANLRPNGSPQPLAGREPSGPLPAKPSSAPQGELERARSLADAGRLEEAAQICEAHLRRYGASAQAYYLLGLLRDACGEAGAVDCYRKALYLEPNHYDSLLQMALLSQKNGDTARARSFKSRAQRMKARP